MVATIFNQFLTQDVTAEIQDAEDIDDRSDIDVYEDFQAEKGWVAYRTAAVEEQAAACKLVCLLASKLQEHFYPFVEATAQVMLPLLYSPHEDVKQQVIATFPELVRATGRAMTSDKGPIHLISGVAIGRMVQSLERENVFEIILTELQAMKLIIQFCSADWSDPAVYICNRDMPLPADSSVCTFLNKDQMVSLSQCAKILLRESVQRRAMMRAESLVIVFIRFFFHFIKYTTILSTVFVHIGCRRRGIR